MLDLRRIREETDLVKAGLARRGNPAWLTAIDDALALDERRRALIGEVDALRARRNEESQRVAVLKREKKQEDADAVIRATRELGDRMSGLERELDDVEAALRELLLGIPNLPDEIVPEGGESASRVLREWGAEPTFTFTPKPHWDLGEALGILDLARGAKVAGSGFPLLRGLGARLERGLISFMMDLHAREHGYEELWPPFLVNREAATGTGHLPKFGDDMYEVPLDGLWLVPTAEVPVTNLHAGELLPVDALPLRYVAYTPCFRREAGAHGKDTRGLLRLHQFDKVELVRFERPEASEAALEELTSHAETILRRLGLRYRVLLLAAGDLGFANARTYDLEVWAPGVGTWLEVSSCSRYTDYQARRMNLRYRPDPNAKPEFVHTLNGSALALARLVVALLETYQQADGSVVVPEPLRPYLHTDLIAAG
ncbi:MAG TPA: serine--tRNA ligase [Longimicrobiales bacterium]|nr:serine--tRNA ligase [Longimicrobiales bacterium]